MTDDLVRYRDLDPTAEWGDPDGVVEIKGKPMYKFDAAKALSLIGRCQQIGGDHFRASLDLTNMLVVGHEDLAAFSHGFHLVLDESLPENTVVAE